MRVLFDTPSDGRIEVDSQTGKVYFAQSDIEVDLQQDGEFRDLNGREFRIHWPYKPGQKIATLQVREWRYLDSAETQ